MDVQPILDAIDTEELTPVARAAAGRDDLDPTTWRHERLGGGTVAEVFRFWGGSWQGTPWSAVLKLLHPWERPGDPESWRREALLYASDLFEGLPGCLAVPRCYAMSEADGLHRLWLEDVSGTHDRALEPAHYREAARCLAHMQAPYLMGRPLPTHEWLGTDRALAGQSRGWGEWALTKLAATAAPEEVAREHGDSLRALWERRTRLVTLADALPRTLCHRDYNAANLFVDLPRRRTTAIDWDCAGVGMVGEDLADLACEAVVYFGRDPSEAGAIAREVLGGYGEGLAECGCDLPAVTIRRGYLCACALHWAFRVAAFVLATDDAEERDRLRPVLRYLSGLAEEALAGA